jgi:CRISPR system Cascade subunit CasB
MNKENMFKNSCRETAEKLITQCQDRSARSNLRQLLMGIPEVQSKALRYMQNLPRPNSSKQWELLFLIAGLIAEYSCPLPDKTISFGTSLYQLKHHPEINPKGIERRLESLLELERSSLTQPLHSLVLQARKPKIAIDYGTLMYELSCWDSPDKWVQLSWAKDFWCPRKDAQEETLTEDIADETIVLA